MTDANIAVVRDFLESMAAADSAAATSLLSPDIEWRNTGLPTFRGKRVHGMIRDMERRRIGFGAEVHAIAAQGDQVLTDRTDYLWKGPVKTGFWVRGTFTVRDGLITLWDDAFSMGSVLKGFVTR
ncbi:MAG TPA: limonene-1,2-epoxide hydrolase family protein [Nocardioidaceae bacterium]|nr:limonene-1,2-epoxide hydrolase family protein [Nocardioidaceae bacterium]